MFEPVQHPSEPVIDLSEALGGLAAGNSSLSRKVGMARRTFLQRLGLAVGLMAVSGCTDDTAPTRLISETRQPMPEGSPATLPSLSGAALTGRKKTLFGIGYETWFLPAVGSGGWTNAEAKPVLGNYSSLDPKVIRQHARWIYDAGFDFIMIDWSNNFGDNWTNGVAEGIMGATMRLLEEYAHLKHCPKFALLLGSDHGSVITPRFGLQSKRIEQEILAKPAYARLWQHFDGKPLLCIYPIPSSSYSNPHFTVRSMGAFHEITLNPAGAWSWCDRTPIVNGPATPIFPFEDQSLKPWKAGPGWSLTGHSDVGVYATHPPGSGGSLISPAFTVTDRVLTFNYSGTDYWVSAGLRFNGSKIPTDQTLFVLRDADTGEVLRRAFPPGTSKFTMRQWDVADFMGRRVIFEAAAGAAASVPYGGSLSFGGLAFTRNEQMVASVALGGNEAGGGGWLDWDAHLRCSGATLAQFLCAAFRFEPQVMMIQQWNEFCAPDQYGIEASNDIEPTMIGRLEGPESNGWGYYYLNLTAKLIQQYRQGFRVPQVLLDTRYP